MNDDTTGEVSTETVAPPSDFTQEFAEAQEKRLEAQAEPEPKEEAKAPPEPEPAKETAPEWSLESRLWATEIGLTPEEMKQFADERTFSSFAEKVYRSASRKEVPSTAAAYRTEEPAQPQKQSVQPQPIEMPDLSEVDPQVAKAIGALATQNQSQAGRIEELIDVIQNMHTLVSQQDRTRAEVEDARAWDSIFNQIGNDAVFGKGSIFSGELTDDQKQARLFVAHAVRAERQTSDVLPLTVHVARKAESVFGRLLDRAAQRASEESAEVAAHATPAGRSSAKKGARAPSDGQVLGAWRKRHGLG